MAKEKAKIEIWSEFFLKKTMFIWLPIAALKEIIKRLRNK